MSEAAEKHKTALCDTTEVTALFGRATVLIMNMDPLITKEELVVDMRG